MFWVTTILSLPLSHSDTNISISIFSGAIASQETKYGFYDHNENVPLVIRAECGGSSELTIDLPLGSRESQTVLVYRDGAGEVKLYPAHKMDQIQKDNSDPMPFVRSASS